MGKHSHKKYKLSEPAKTLFIMVDYQAAMFAGVTSHESQNIMNNAQIVAYTAKIFGCKHILSTITTGTFSGPIMPELQAIFSTETPIERTAINAWIDPNFKAAVRASGCRRIVFSGLWTSMCVCFPVIELLREGYDVIFVADACGDSTKEAHDMAIARMIQAGATPVTALELLFEYQQDWSRSETYAQVTYVMANLCNFKNPWRLIHFFKNKPSEFVLPVQVPADIAPLYPVPSSYTFPTPPAPR